MSDQNQLPNPTPAAAPEPPKGAEEPESPRRLRRRGGGVVGGAILIVIGLTALLQQFFHLDSGLYFLPMLAVIFLAAGIVGRRPGLLIPGGILAGIGAGAILMQGPFSYMESQAGGGVFMLAFAGGWVLITLTSVLIGRLMLWPLIPAAFMAVVGLGLVAGEAGMQFLKLAGLGWPVVLIAIGLYLVFRRRELRK